MSPDLSPYDDALLQAANTFANLIPCTNPSTAGDNCGACCTCRTWAMIRQCGEIVDEAPTAPTVGADGSRA